MQPGKEYLPRLKAVVDELGGCNDLLVLSQYHWPQDLGINYDRLEEEASRLQEDEILTFVDGEKTEMDALVAKYGITELDQFLEEIFGGSLWPHFFE